MSTVTPALSVDGLTAASMHISDWIDEINSAITSAERVEMLINNLPKFSLGHWNIHTQFVTSNFKYADQRQLNRTFIDRLVVNFTESGVFRGTQPGLAIAMNDTFPIHTSPGLIRFSNKMVLIIDGQHRNEAVHQWAEGDITEDYWTWEVLHPGMCCSTASFVILLSQIEISDVKYIETDVWQDFRTLVNTIHPQLEESKLTVARRLASTTHGMYKRSVGEQQVEGAVNLWTKKTWPPALTMMKFPELTEALALWLGVFFNDMEEFLFSEEVFKSLLQTQNFIVSLLLSELECFCLFNTI